MKGQYSLTFMTHSVQSWFCSSCVKGKQILRSLASWTFIMVKTKKKNNTIFPSLCTDQEEEQAFSVQNQLPLESKVWFCQSGTLQGSPRPLLSASLAVHEQKRSMNQCMEADLWHSNSPISTLNLQLILLWIPVFHLTSSMCLMWLVIYIDGTFSSQSSGRKLKLMFKLASWFHTKKLTSNCTWN